MNVTNIVGLGIVFRIRYGSYGIITYIGYSSIDGEVFNNCAVYKHAKKTMIVLVRGKFKAADSKPLSVKMTFIAITVNIVANGIFPWLTRHVNVGCKNSIGGHVGTTLIH